MKYRIREQNELKPSGVEWLGDIPKSWYLSKLKYLAKIITGYTPPMINSENYDCKGMIWVKPDNLNEFHYINDSKEKISNEAIKKQNIVPKDSILVCCIGSIGKFGIAGENLLTNQQINSIVFNKNINKYFSKYMIFSSKQEHIRMANGNVVQILNSTSQSNIYFSTPNLSEQQKIANFLDEKSKIFDEAISKKEQLISKLELAKQSLISEIVTGKLKIVEQNSKLQTIKREKNELKPSGVEWLGDIPKDWKVKKSKYLFEIRKRIAGTLGFDVLSITQKGIKIKDIETGGGQLSMDYSKYQIVNIGDFAMNHMDLLTGFVDIAKVQGVTSPDYRVFSLIDKNSDSNFYLYLFQMGYKNQIFFAFGQGSSQLGRWRFPTEEFNKFYFPYPSLEEQQKISKYLDEKLIHFDNTIEKTKQSITKLKEAKEALISQAVTGKIEVL
ncbi:restriction endonuclease subunit S [Aliarcobacter butzleri]|uniref:restriction endonuclease subunit S n=1 Tax=Aliarcobacter butzleri TaxID=28197 RepID=UPI00102DBD56|nr:restriction endonuclease subunit S [Aliarcobacter butzleri]RZV14602.1 restriction endonuclease subunit S [Aliarcobacter butzleri]